MILKIKKFYSKLAFITLVLSLAVFAHTSLSSVNVYSASFTPNTFSDTNDANLGDGICADSGNLCSLRAAIEEANALVGTDTIILSAGTYQIINTLEIIDGITINGAGASNTTIESQDSSTTGLQVLNTSTPVRIYALSIRGNSLNQCNTGVGLINSQDVIVSDIAVHYCSVGLNLNASKAQSNNSSYYSNDTGVTSNTSELTLNSNNIHSNTNAGVFSIDSINTISQTKIYQNSVGVYISNADNTKTSRISDSIIELNNNQSSNFSGGGIFFQEGCAGSSGSSGSSLYIKNTEIRNNQATNGAGVLNKCGHLDIENTTIANNIATVSGGGLQTDYINSTDNQSFTEIRNSTISLNTAPKGGGVYVNTERTVPSSVPFTFDMTHTTMAYNSSGIFFEDTNGSSNTNPINVRLRNNLFVSNNSNNFGFSQGSGSEGGVLKAQSIVLGVTYDGGNNLSDDASGLPLSSVTQNNTLSTFLGPLANNGNIVRTHALLAGSPAINFGGSDGCLAGDEALQTRPSGPACDAGSFEYQFATTAITPNSSTLISGSSSKNTGQTLIRTGGYD